MNRETPYTPVYKRALFALLSTCLALGMLPTYAFGNEKSAATAQRPAIVSEEVAVGDGLNTAAEVVADAGSEGPASEVLNGETSSGSAAKPVNLSSSDEVKAPSQVTADVPISSSLKTQKTLLVDGLEYVIDREACTAELVGWYGVSPSGDLAVPAQVSDEGATYVVVALGSMDDALSDSNDESSNKPSDASQKSAGGGSIFSASELQSVNLPATIQFINPEFFSGCVSLRSISISSQNETYSSFDGMVFAKDFSQLLLIPESKEGAAIIPDATTSVPAKVLSHRPLVTSLSAGDGSTAFASENGILYTKDKKMLVACPGGYGDAFVISENVESIGPDAFAGNVFRSIIVRGTVTNIDPTAFSAQSQSEAAVVLRGGESYAAHKAVWEQAGFSHFAEPAEPGTSFEPNGKTDDDTSGFAYTMLPDYTLSVSWKGSAEPDANLSIPAAAEIGGVTYRVSEIAPYAFKEKLLESVAMPASVTTVGEGAFQGCANLKSVSLVEGLLLVDALAFERTALAAVILPTTIGMIGERAFADNADLARIVALSSRTEAMPNAIEGCSGVSILVPYQESGAYHWTPGIAALGNHIEPYGFVSDEESLSLKVGETSNLFNAGKVFVPASCEITYSYPATSVSVDEDGFVKGKAVGTADVVAAVTLNGIELSRGFRSVEVAQQVISDTEDGVFGVKEMPEVRMSPLPLTRMMLALEGNEIAPRADMKGISGGCTWDIDASGKLTIKPTSGDSGVLASFNNTESGAPWYEFRTLITSVDMQAGVSGGSSIVCMFAGCINLTVLDLSSFNTGNVINMAGMFDGCTKLTSLNLSKFVTSKVVFTANMFRDCSSLVELDLSSFDTVAVEGMDGMFNGCSSLAALDLSNFNTAKTVNMGVMFHGCKSLINLDLSNFNTENVKHMDNMFSGCSSLTALNLAKFITSNAVNMGNMFSGCSSLSVLDLSSFTTAQVKYMGAMFEGCSNLTALDLLKFDTTNVLEMQQMFSGCEKLTALDLSNFRTPNLLHMVAMFDGCSSLASLDVSNFNTSGVMNMDNMFKNCSSLTALDITNFNTSSTLYMGAMFYACSSLKVLDVSRMNTENVSNMGHMFRGCSSLLSLDVSNFVTTKAVYMNSMFEGCSGLTNLNLSNFDTKTVIEMSNMFYNCTNLAIVNVSSFNTINVKSMAGMFNSCNKLEAIDVSKFDTSNVQWMQGMFRNCSILTELNLSNFNTSNVVNMDEMFLGCSGLTKLDLSAFDTSKVEYMSSMFGECTGLVELNVSKFNTASVMYMGNIFYNCSSLTSLDVSSFNTAKVKKMNGIFFGCSSLSAIDVSGFDTSSAEEIHYMFYKCSSLTSLDLSNFRTGNATNMDAMFSGCSGLTRLNLSTFNTSKATYMTNMFYDCSRLTELTVSSFNTENVGYMGDMFKGCSSLTALDLSSFKTANVKAMYGMFSGCSKLTTLDLSNFVTADGINAGDLFKDTQELASIKIGAGFSLDLPQKTGTSVTTGATYSGKWIAQSDKSVYANNAYPKGAVDTYSAQLSYTLSFDTQEGSAPPESKLVVVGDKVAPVGDPEKTGCTFNGWFKEAECINAWIFSKDTMPAHDLTLYASWSTSVLTVTFQTNGGSAIDPAKVDYGAKLTAPTPPLRQGYTFVGWYRDRTLAIPWNFTTDTVTDNIELFAKWAAVVDVDVPIDPRIDIDAKGNVTPGEAATKPFVSRSIKPIAVTEIACATTGTTKLVFPDEAQWLGIKVSVAQPSDPLGGTEIKLGRAVSGRLFEIPAAPLNGTSELPLTFGLEFPAGTSIAYVPSESGTAVATLKYTFALL